MRSDYVAAFIYSPHQPAEYRSLLIHVHWRVRGHPPYEISNMAGCYNPRRLTFIGIWMYVMVSVECEDKKMLWDGCVSNFAVTDVDICYNITAPMDGIAAWKACSSIILSQDFITSPGADRFLTSLRSLMNESGIKEPAVWVGGIQVHLDSPKYVSHDGLLTSSFPSDDSATGRRCLALNTSNPEDFRVIGRDCAKELPMVCAFRKFVGTIHDAEACTAKNAVILEPLTFCYEKEETCTRTKITILPTQDLKLMKKYHPVSVEIIKMKIDGKLYLKTNETYPNTTDICYISDGKGETSTTAVRLELRYNKTAGALALWVKNGANAVWPPKCVGGDVRNPAGDQTTLLVTPSTGENASSVVWCYVKNFVTGSIAISNSVMSSDRARSETCPPFDIAGFKDVTVNERASCLRCLRMALSKCSEDTRRTCFPSCRKGKRCGYFKIKLEEWKNELKRGGDFEDMKKCATDEVCAGEAFWQLTDGGDCNGDGVFDCDDRFMRLNDRTCSGNATLDLRESNAGIKFWNCRTNHKRDFVDVLVDNKTARYFCENDMPKERSWASPVYLEKVSPYVLSASTTPPPVSPTTPLVPTTTSPLPSTTPKPMTQKQATRALHKLTIKPNVTITKKDMEDIVKDMSNILNLGEQALLKAQMEANVSSLAQLLESILVFAPDDFNLTTDKLAVSKERAMGFQVLLSDKPSVAGDSFGPVAKLIPLKDKKDLDKFRNDIEAAVILPDLPENVTLVVVTFAKSNDFIPCRPPQIAENLNNSNNKSTSDVISPSNSSYSANETIGLPSMDSANKTEETIHTDVSKKYCPFRAGIVMGCINSHIVQVGLLNNNGSYQKMPVGKHVDLLFRTKTNESLGRYKKCVYWDFDKKGWASQGCTLVKQKDGLDTCRCTHLTHFAQLMADGGAVSGAHAEALRTLSVCACAVSVFALCGVLSAGAFSRKWREKKENKIMLNLAVALSSFMLLFLWSAVFAKPPLDVHRCRPAPPPTLGCRARGVALHYAVLSSFCWMLVEAQTHYWRLASLVDIDVRRFVLKAALVGWGVPVVPVAALLAADADTYAGTGRDFCYPSGAAFYAAVLAPICAALLANAVIFARVLRLLFSRAARPWQPGANERRLLYRKVIVCVAFTFLFGLTWYVGLLSFTEEAAFFFGVVVMMQGPALFVFFVLGEENVKKRLKSIVRRGVGSSEHSSSGSASVHPRTGRLNVRPDKIPLSPSYHSSTSTSPVSEGTPCTELRSFE